MDVPDWLRYTLLAVGAILSSVCLMFVVRSVRRLNKGIEEFEAELEARQGAPVDPYAALAEIYAQVKPQRSSTPRRPTR